MLKKLEIEKAEINGKIEKEISEALIEKKNELDKKMDEEIQIKIEEKK